MHVWGWNAKLELVFCCELDDVLFQELEGEGTSPAAAGPRRRRRRSSRTKRMKGRKWRMVHKRSPKHRGALWGAAMRGTGPPTSVTTLLPVRIPRRCRFVTCAQHMGR